MRATIQLNNDKSNNDTALLYDNRNLLQGKILRAFEICVAAFNNDLVMN